MRIGNFSIYLDMRNLKNKQKNKTGQEKRQFKVIARETGRQKLPSSETLKLQFRQFLSQLHQQMIMSRKS